MSTSIVCSRVCSRFAALLCIALFSVGCSHLSKAGEGRNPNVITEEEIANVKGETAYDIIAKLRGNYLTSRGKSSLTLKVSTQPSVFLDNQEYGPVNTLKSIPASHILEIRFFEGWDATTKYGNNHTSGVIQIYTRH